jgi:very-short-patch-repair endonuclease
MAAVIASGAGAALSHRSAAVLWALLPPRGGSIHVSTRSRSGRVGHAGIHLHRCRSLGAELLTELRGVPVTTPARTVADLRGSVPGWELRRATRQAQFLGLPLGPEAGTGRTRSDLEDEFLDFCAAQRLPAPEVNVRVGRWTVDFLWRRQRIAVETDYYGYHRGSVAFEDDHARDLDLRRYGYDVRRFTGRQLRDQPAQVAADLRDALGLAS